MIPKIIHFCWLSDDRYPTVVEKCLNSWKKYLPDYQIMLWDTKRFDVDQSLWVKQAFEKKKYAFAADYIRFYSLYYYGGIYLDSDVEVLKSFDDLLYLPYFVGAENAGTIEAAVIGSEKKCDWIKDCMDYYEKREFIQSDGTLDIRKLPGIMDEIIKKSRSIVDIKGSAVDDKILRESKDVVFVFPSYYFSPKIFDSRKIMIRPQTYAIHHYQNSWFSNKALIYYRTRSFLIRIFGYNLIRKIEKQILHR